MLDDRTESLERGNYKVGTVRPSLAVPQYGERQFHVDNDQVREFALDPKYRLGQPHSNFRIPSS